MTAWGEVALGWALHLGAPAEGGALKWDRADGCPSEVEVVGAVERYLGVAIAESSGADKRIAATAAKQRDGWVARVEVIEEGGNRTRTLPAAPTCAEAAEAAALVIAISIDPEAVERTEAAREDAVVPEPEPQPKTEAREDEAAAKPEPRVEPVTPKIASAPVPPRQRIALRGAVGIHGGVEYGALPNVTGLVGGSVSLLGPRFRVFVDANVLPQNRVDLSGGGRADFRLWAIGVGGCPVFEVGKQWSLAPCLAVEAGQVIGAPAPELPGQRRGAAAWVAARAIGRVYWRPHRLVGLHLGPELVVPIVRPRFTANGGQVHESRVAGVRGTLGIEVQFP